MVRWSKKAEEAFFQLKRMLCSRLILKSPDFTKEFLVQTDASEVGLGAVLSQTHKGEEHPVLYISRKLAKHEKNYATIEKECLAIKWALEALKYHLLGRKFVLMTDHAPLQWMARNKESNGRITRWFLSLKTFNFSVVHRPGRCHGNADALSRKDVLFTVACQPRASEQRRGVCGIMRGRVLEGRYIALRWLEPDGHLLSTTKPKLPESTAAANETSSTL